MFSEKPSLLSSLEADLKSKEVQTFLPILTQAMLQFIDPSATISTHTHSFADNLIALRKQLKKTLKLPHGKSLPSPQPTSRRSQAHLSPTLEHGDSTLVAQLSELEEAYQLKAATQMPALQPTQSIQRMTQLPIHTVVEPFSSADLDTETKVDSAHTDPRLRNHLMTIARLTGYSGTDLERLQAVAQEQRTTLMMRGVNPLARLILSDTATNEIIFINNDGEPIGTIAKPMHIKNKTERTAFAAGAILAEESEKYFAQAYYSKVALQHWQEAGFTSAPIADPSHPGTQLIVARDLSAVYRVQAAPAATSGVPSNKAYYQLARIFDTQHGLNLTGQDIHFKIDPATGQVPVSDFDPLLFIPRDQSALTTATTTPTAEPTAGIVSPFEQHLCTAINHQLLSPKIQHGCEVRNPGEPSALPTHRDPVLIVEPEQISVATDSIQFFHFLQQQLSLNRPITVHTAWPAQHLFELLRHAATLNDKENHAHSLLLASSMDAGALPGAVNELSASSDSEPSVPDGMRLVTFGGYGSLDFTPETLDPRHRYYYEREQRLRQLAQDAVHSLPAELIATNLQHIDAADQLARTEGYEQAAKKLESCPTTSSRGVNEHTPPAREKNSAPKTPSPVRPNLCTWLWNQLCCQKTTTPVTHMIHVIKVDDMHFRQPAHPIHPPHDALVFSEDLQNSTQPAPHSDPTPRSV